MNDVKRLECMGLARFKERLGNLGHTYNCSRR